MAEDARDERIVFEPETRKTGVVSALFLLCAGIVTWLGLDVALLTDWQEPGVVAVFALVAGVLVLIAYLWWRAEPLVLARLEVGPDGISFEQWKRMRVPPQSLGWDEVAALLHRSYPRQPRFLGIELQPREGATRGRIHWIQTSALDHAPGRPFDIVRNAAQSAGFAVRPDTGIRQLGFTRRYALRAVAGPPDGDTS